MSARELAGWKCFSGAWFGFFAWWAPDMLPLWIVCLLVALKLWDLADAECRRFSSACDQLAAFL